MYISNPKESVVKLAAYNMLSKEVEALVKDMKKQEAIVLNLTQEDYHREFIFTKLKRTGLLKQKK